MNERPMDDLQLAQELDRALRESAPAEAASAAVRPLLETVEAIRQVGPAVQPSAAYRSAARARLVAHMASNPALPVEAAKRAEPVPPALYRRAAPWLMRVAAGFVAVGLVLSGTVSASASALPGEPLYRVKQATEAVELQLAPSETQRISVLLRHADTRLEEVQRLVAQGRAADASGAAEQLESTVSRAVEQVTATTRTNVSAPGGAAFVSGVEAHLASQQERLARLAEQAPASVRPALQEAKQALGLEVKRVEAVRETLAPRRAATPPGRPTDTAKGNRSQTNTADVTAGERAETATAAGSQPADEMAPEPPTLPAHGAAVRDGAERPDGPPPANRGRSEAASSGERQRGGPADGPGARATEATDARPQPGPAADNPNARRNRQPGAEPDADSGSDAGASSTPTTGPSTPARRPDAGDAPRGNGNAPSDGTPGNGRGGPPAAPGGSDGPGNENGTRRGPGRDNPSGNRNGNGHGQGAAKPGALPAPSTTQPAPPPIQGKPSVSSRGGSAGGQARGR